MASSISSTPLAPTDPALAQALAAARTRLEAKGLFGRAGDSISLRLADRPQMLWDDGQKTQTISLSSPGAGPGADPIPGALEQRALDHRALEHRALEHRALYCLRPDVGAIVIAHSPWGSRLARLRVSMPAIFDEQIRQLGPAVTDWPRPGAPSQELARGDNAFTHGAGVLCLGMTPERAVFNLELLEKCAQSFVLAHLTGQPIGRIPRWVQWIAVGRLKKDQRRAAAAFGRGEYPALSAGY